MKKTFTLKASAAPLALGLALVSTPAFAQDGEEAAEDAGDAIVVTGSRIQNPNLELSSPVSVVTADDINLRAASTAEQFIREIPGIVPSTGSNVNNGNGGSTFLNLRGIGANRNIVLLNGTRIVPAGLAGVTNVDLIPVALLERVDVLNNGAGAVYGADAISGVVNFITKSDFAGADLSVTQGLTEQGDGSETRIDLTLGANFDDGRGNATLSLGYTNRNQITQGDRDFGEFNIDSGDASPGGSATSIPPGVFVPGFFGQVGSDFDSIGGFDTPFNFNPFNLFQTPLEQFRIYGTANYELTDGIEIYSEGLFVQNVTSTQIAPSGSFFSRVNLPLNNPFIGDGLRNDFCGILNIDQATCDAAGATPFGPTLADGSANPDYLEINPQLGRRFVELGTRDNRRETQFFQVKVGLRGDITDNIQFDVVGAYGESDIFSQQNGNGTLTRLNQSLQSVDPDVCLDPSNGCVPINLFGPLGTLGGNAGTEALAAFLDVGNNQSTTTSLGSLIGTISGDLGFTIPTADEPVGFVVGGEYREYTAFISSDLLSQTAGEVLGNGAAAPNQGGGYDVKELFGELLLPLVADAPFAEEINLELGARLSDYSTTGSEFTWKAGGSWTFGGGVTLRGSFQKVTRAPNIGELFSPVQTGLGNNSNDPCANGAPTGNATLIAICDSQVLPGGAFPGFATAGPVPAEIAGQVNVTGGGNANLAAEEADTYTIGFIVQPDFVPGLSVTVDYYNINVTGAITSPSEQDVIDACFTAAGGGLGSPSCDLIRRNADTGAVAGPVSSTPGFITQLSNLGEINTDGVDFTMQYQTDVGFADLILNWAANWTNSSRFQANPAAVDRECVGFFSTNCGSIQPEISWNARTTLAFDDIDVSLNWRYIDGVSLEPEVLAEANPANAILGSPANTGPAADALPGLTDFTVIPAEHYFDLAVRATPMENLTLTFTVLNLLDNQPTIVGSDVGTTSFNSGNIYPSTYDPLGRRYAITAGISF